MFKPPPFGKTPEPTSEGVIEERSSRRLMVDSVSIAYILLGMASGALLYLIVKMIKRNQQSAIADNAPVIAGSDELGGKAKNPDQFTEPDDDALDEMGDLLASAAEAQGIEYEED